MLEDEKMESLEEMAARDRWVARALRAKAYLAGLGAVGVGLWFLIKWIICTFFGVCLL